MSKLSPAQRQMLHNAVYGKPLRAGLHSNTTKPGLSNTIQALHRRGLLEGIDHRPTTAGRAYFAPITPPEPRH